MDGSGIERRYSLAWCEDSTSIPYIWVLFTAGTITLVQEIDGREVRTTLQPGQYAINEPGVWHTADVEGPATAVFITAGMGTQHRPR